MLQGVLHRRKGDQLRLAQRTQESSQQLEWALQFFEKASTLMNAESIYVDVTQVCHPLSLKEFNIRADKKEKDYIGYFIIIKVCYQLHLLVIIDGALYRNLYYLI